MPEANRDKPRFFRLIAIVAAVIAALVAVDVFLENAENSELQTEAQDLYARGVRLLAVGMKEEAVDVLRTAHSLERRNPDYELELVDALIATGKTEEAERLTNDVLERTPNNGRANLIAARLALKVGDAADAGAYYHRAIYGEWQGDAGGHRISARMELVDVLAKNGGKKDLLAELLPLEQETGSDANLQHRLARLFLLAGSAQRAADVYHALIRRDPTDVKSYLGLGEAELERGRYGDAQKAFLAAFRREPDISVRSYLELASTMAALDPTSRRLEPLEKYRRSLRILQLASESLSECTASKPAAASDEVTKLLASYRDAAAVRISGQITNELSEGELALAEKIWQGRIQACGGETTPKEEPVRLIMEKLAQPSA